MIARSLKLLVNLTKGSLHCHKNATHWKQRTIVSSLVIIIVPIFLILPVPQAVWFMFIYWAFFHQDNWMDFEELAQPPPSGAHCPFSLIFLFFSTLASSTPQPVWISSTFLTDCDILIVGSSYCLLREQKYFCFGTKGTAEMRFVLNKKWTDQLM